MLTNIKQFVKDHQDDIMLLIGVILISLLSFAAGFILAKRQAKEPLKIEYNNSRIFTDLGTNFTNIIREISDQICVN